MMLTSAPDGAIISLNISFINLICQNFFRLTYAAEICQNGRISGKFNHIYNMVKHCAKKKIRIMTDKMLKMLISIWLIKKIILILRLLSSVVKVIK